MNQFRKSSNLFENKVYLEKFKNIHQGDQKTFPPNRNHINARIAKNCAFPNEYCRLFKFLVCPPPIVYADMYPRIYNQPCFDVILSAHYQDIPINAQKHSVKTMYYPM